MDLEPRTMNSMDMTQRVIGKSVAFGLVLDESWLWHPPDFETAAKLVLVAFGEPVAFGKGAILPVSDADIIILNPNSGFEINAKSHHSKLDTNVYEGRRGKNAELASEVCHGRCKIPVADYKVP
ncbi:hypothetical protein JHK87_006626 [Glycine soja]|nr:hypothetical protein JHK87_006626 [Glycine soja]